MLTDRNAADMFVTTVLDRPFASARKAEQLEKALSKKAEEGDSKAVKSEELYNRARTLSWSLVYFLAKARFPEFINFLGELGKLPRDADLGGEAVVGAFGRAYGLGGGGLGGAGIDVERFLEIGGEWYTFMAQQQSPSRKLKLDDLQVRGPSGGGPGFPGVGGPGRPGLPGRRHARATRAAARRATPVAGPHRATRVAARRRVTRAAGPRRATRRGRVGRRRRCARPADRAADRQDVTPNETARASGAGRFVWGRLSPRTGG